MRVGGHLILSLQRNAIGAAISQRIIAISLWDQYSIKPRHLPNISDARNVQKVMCKQKKIPFEIRFCLRPCYQDTWIMTLSSTVKTLIFFFFFPTRNTFWYGCVLELNLQPRAGRNWDLFPCQLSTGASTMTAILLCTDPTLIFLP